MSGISWLLLLLFCNQADQANNDANAVRSAAALARDIGRSANLNVEVGRDIRELPVLVLRRNCKPTDLLRGLATALHASIVRDSNVIRIIRTIEVRKALRTIDQEVVRNSIHRREALWDKELQDIPKSGSPAALFANRVHLDAVSISTPSSLPGTINPRGIDPGLITPVGHLLRGLVARLPIDEISAIEPEEGKTFSNDPTPVETRLANTDVLLKQFAIDQALFAKDPALSVTEQDKRASMDAYLFPRRNVGLDGLKYLLVVARNLDAIRFSLSVYNSDGVFVAGAWTWTLPRDNTLPYQQAALTANLHSDSGVELKPDQIEFERAISASQWQVPPGSVLWNRLLHPESYDPANYLVPTALQSWTDSDQKPVIAVLSDDVVMAAHYSVVGNKINSAAFDVLTSNSIERFEESGIRILRPRNPLWAETYTCNRTTLGTALRRFVRQGQVDLRGYSVLSYEQNFALSLVPKQLLDAVKFSAVIPICDTNMYSEVFQILGAIPDDRWEAAQNGSTTEVRSDVFRAKLWRLLQRMPYKPENIDQLPEVAQQITVSLPDGIPAHANLQLKGHTDLALRLPTKGLQNGQGDSDLVGFIRLLHSPLQTQFRALPQETVHLDKSLAERSKHALAAPATRATMEVTFDIAPHYILSFALTSPCRILGPMGPFERLPASYLKAAQDEWDRLESIGSNSQSRNGKGN